MNAPAIDLAAATLFGSADRGRALPWSRSQRLVLREFLTADAEALAAMHRDPRIAALLIDNFPLQLRRIAGLFIQRMSALYREHEGLGIWHAGLRQQQAAFAGWFSLMPMSGRPGEVEIGSRLLPSTWGSGLAQEGGEMILDHASEDLGLSSVWGVCHPSNRCAMAVLAAMGFEAQGVMPYEGHPASHHRLAMNAWRELRNIPRGARLRRAVRATAAQRRAPL